jgi:hypothetical protein
MTARAKKRVMSRNFIAILKKARYTYASRPAEASTCSSVIFHSGMIQPKKVSGRSGRAVARSFCFLRAA